MNTATIVQKLWNYCNVLRDDGMSYGDYVEQLTYLLFLKMADERAKAPYNQKSPVPSTYSWPSLIKKDGDELFDQFSGSHYPALARKPSPRLLPRAFGRTEVHWTSVRSRLTRHTLEALGNQKGLLGLIFNKSQNKFDSPHPWASAFGRAARAQIDSGHPWPSPSGRASLVQFRFKRNCRSRRICQDPAKLRRLVVDLIDKGEARSAERVSMSADVKGDAYEGLLEKNAQDTKSGADETIRRKLLHDCNVHTLLRLLTELFYTQGVKANVLFFDKKPASETRGLRCSGSTTCARTCTTRSRPTRSSAKAWTNSSPATAWSIAPTVKPPSHSKPLTVVFARTPTTNSSTATKSRSTFSGLKTNPSRNPTTSPRRR